MVNQTIQIFARLKPTKGKKGVSTIMFKSSSLGTVNEKERPAVADKTRATLAKRLHGLCKCTVVVSCIGSLG